MSDTLASLRRKISGADDLESVVRSMKALAAASIGQYEKSVLALADYYRTVELGLVVCLRQHAGLPSSGTPTHSFEFESVTSGDHVSRKGLAAKSISAIVFGSDQGLVGQFNEVLVEFVVNALAALPGKK